MVEPIRTYVTFTSEELWLLQGVMKHEMAQMEQWQEPPVSRDLVIEIARGLVLCTKNEATDYVLPVSERDCLSIAYHVPNTAKGVNGQPVGRVILLKAFEALGQLETMRAGYIAIEEPEGPTKSEIVSRLNARGGN